MAHEDDQEAVSSLSWEETSSSRKTGISRGTSLVRVDGGRVGVVYGPTQGREEKA